MVMLQHAISVYWRAIQFISHLFISHLFVAMGFKQISSLILAMCFFFSGGMFENCNNTFKKTNESKTSSSHQNVRVRLLFAVSAIQKTCRQTHQHTSTSSTHRQPETTHVTTKQRSSSLSSSKSSHSKSKFSKSPICTSWRWGGGVAPSVHKKILSGSKHLLKPKGMTGGYFEDAWCIAVLCNVPAKDVLFQRMKEKNSEFTPPKINIEPENGELEDDFAFPGMYSQVSC